MALGYFSSTYILGMLVLYANIYMMVSVFVTTFTKHLINLKKCDTVTDRQIDPFESGSSPQESIIRI